MQAEVTNVLIFRSKYLRQLTDSRIHGDTLSADILACCRYLQFLFSQPFFKNYS